MFPSILYILALSNAVQGATLANNKVTFARPIVTRYWQNGVDITGVDATTLGKALCPYLPSYVNGLVYINASQAITDDIVSDYNTIRNIVRNGDGGSCKGNPNAKFDVEITINTQQNPPNPLDFQTQAQLQQKMTQIHDKFGNDGFWFDFYTSNYKNETDGMAVDLTDQAVLVAHQLNTTVGGNVFQTTMGVPPGSDAIAFVDDLVSPDFQFGFEVDTQKIGSWRTLIANSNTVLMGHLASNPQNEHKEAIQNRGSIPNGNFTGTESCVYNGITPTYVGNEDGTGRSTLITQAFDVNRRSNYNRYWAGLQQQYDFTYMFPGFYPVCGTPLVALNPLENPFKNGSTLLDVLYQVAEANPGPNAN